LTDLPDRPLLHITERAAWDEATARGEYLPPSLEMEGFIHLSLPQQVVGTAERFYRGRSGLVLLVIDVDRLSAPVCYEAAADHGTFPHLYGPLNLEAVAAVLPFAPEPDGTFRLPPSLSAVSQ
jgi:uncharacterized protein (DUF952 family)